MEGKKVFLLSFLSIFKSGYVSGRGCCSSFPYFTFSFLLCFFLSLFHFYFYFIFYFFHTSSLVTLESPQVIFKNPLGISSPLHLVSSPPPF
ncbi:hypothetical protein BDV39DRAFT_30237 [Aspergillus sergii]|uniref:Uncharacterized protein n=1 Tax=Aspergillus sergii TaxID=1034303 RepID=A0A5N6WJA0_9EURO|nr:hypothetical protein BDV39DRAFT_30237 [Aspergillus sergii]